VLEVHNVEKVYGEGDAAVHALQNINFTVKRGEFILIVGSSGSGKSTLLNMIGLLDRPTSGKVIIDGVDTSTLNDNQLSSFRNSKLGFIFQFSNLLSDLTVLENVLLPRMIQGTEESALEEAKTLLRTVGLESQLNKFGNKISGGQAQRVAITRALINKPAIVLADEPTGNLDSLSAETTVHLLKSLNRKLNQTFVIVTHDKPQFGEVDKVITIKDGKIVEGELETSVA
jgi:lipoprotein-releasing system ATP-binding protein